MNQDTRRLEAIPLDWNALSEQQRNAVEASSRWLVDALGSIPQLKDRPEQFRQSGPVLDSNRRSQLGFIDGDRGMGKSSVLLTLQALTTEDDFFVEDNAKNRADKANKILTAVDRDRYPSTMKLHDGQRRRNVVWLETLDMEPLSKGVNLFAAILARIEQELDIRLNELPPMAAALAEPDGYAGAADKLRQLQNDVAIVWDRKEGGVYEGDPSTRALWVNQAEKAGLEMNQRIGQVLEAMARARWNRKDENPLFVLPVDDFDLAPCHCLELLRLIRMITTPRLFFLVAGNTRIAEAVLKLRTEGDLLSLTDGKPLDSDEVRGNAAEIAANNMRKLLPPVQRVCLAEFRIDEALRIGENTPEGSLLENLKKVSFEVNQTPTGANTMSLAEFIALDKYQHKDQYLVIADWLGGTPRQALDYAGILSQLAENITKNNHQGKLDEQSKDELDNLLLIELVKEIRRQALEEWRISYAQRERLAEMLNTSVNISLNLESHLRVWTKPTQQELKPFEHGKLIYYIADDIRVSIIDEDATVSRVNNIYINDTRVDRDLYVNTDSAANRQAKKGEKLIDIPRRLSTGLLFIHDFAVSLRGGYLQHSPLTLSPEIFSVKMAAMWGVDDSNPIAAIWNPTQWWTFRDNERFKKHWRLHVAQCEGQYGSAWLAAILEVILNKECQPGLSGLTTERLNSLLKELVDEKPTRTARQVLREGTLYTIALLFAPEFKSGLDASKFREIGFFEAIGGYTKNRIREARTYLWQQAWKQDTLNTPQKFALCAAIAPGLLLKSTMEQIGIISKRERLDVDDFPQILKAPKSTSEISHEWEQFKTFQSTFLSNCENEDAALEIKELIRRAEDSYNSLKDSYFNLFFPDFVPTEEDIKRVQQ